MSTIKNKLSAGTSNFAKQALVVATTTIQAANNAFAAGLQTCEEKNAAQILQDTEIRISDAGGVTVIKDGAPLPGGRLGTALGAVTLPSHSAADPRSKAEVWGNHSYGFTFSFEDAVNSGSASGSPVTNRGVCLVAKAFRKNSETDLIPIRCRWRRRLCDDIVTDLYQCDTGVYVLSADDIGCKILVDASPLTSEFHNEIAHGQIGPFEMSTATRRSLDNSLACESTRFPVGLHISHNDFEEIRSENRISRADHHAVTTYRVENVVLHVTAGEIRLMQPGTDNLGCKRDWMGRYGGEFPRVEVDHAASSGLELVLSNDKTDRLRLTALSSSQRDLIALTIRCFHARQYVVTTAILEQTAANTQQRMNAGNPVFNSDDVSASSLDLFVIIERLMSEVNINLDKQARLHRERACALVEKEALEQDVVATIEAYQRLLLSSQPGDPADGMLDSCASLVSHGGGASISVQSSAGGAVAEVAARASQIADLQGRLKDAEHRARKNNDKLNLLQLDYKALQKKQQRSLNSQPEGDSFMSKFSEQQKILVLEEKIQNLTKTNDELSSRNRKQLEQTVSLTKDLERFKKSSLESGSVDGSATYGGILPSTGQQLLDSKNKISALTETIDQLNSEKQSLLGRIYTLEVDHKELSESFLYVKDKLDTQIGQLRGNHESSERRVNELHRDTKKQRDKLRDVEEERDNLVTDRNRLLKKVESLTKDLQQHRRDMEGSTARLSEATSQLDLEKSSAISFERTLEEQKVKIEHLENTLAKSDRNETVDKLRRELDEKDQVIQQLQTENQTLKSRIRRLAAN